MKKKKKTVLCSAMGILVVLMVIIGIWIAAEHGATNQPSYGPVGEASALDPEIINGNKYTNLIFHDFEVVVGKVEGVYNIEILSNNSYLERTFLENFDIMNEVIDKFFLEEFDKSYIVADFPLDEETIRVNYDDIETVCTDEKYDTPRISFLFGNNTRKGGYMVQIDECLRNVWFSKNGLNNIIPSQAEYKEVYSYLSGVRQGEDVEINLKDGTVKLSEMEEKVLSFLNENFPMDVSDNISLGIGDARIVQNGDHEGVCFMVRRIYKGIPFEYGSTVQADQYIDEFGHDNGEIAYAVSTSPDSMLAFGKVDGTVVETEKITDLISINEAVRMVSEKIGENSIYDVYGVELVYRECEIPEERAGEVEAILKPNWKIITINQNDSKYTLFYVNVVTGEITERFEYYYE